MSITTALGVTLAGLLRWLLKYLAWLGLAATTTLGGALVLMLLKDWTLKSVLVSLLAWPASGLAMVLGLIVALLPLGRVYFWSAAAGGLLYNLTLLLVRRPGRGGLSGGERTSLPLRRARSEIIRPRRWPFQSVFSRLTAI